MGDGMGCLQHCGQRPEPVDERNPDLRGGQAALRLPERLCRVVARRPWEYQRSGVRGAGWIRLDDSFLAGGAGRFAETGVSVTAVDSPSDKINLKHGFRSSPEHAQDMATVIEFLRKEAPGKPVCLIGTSIRSLSATSGATLLKGEKYPTASPSPPRSTSNPNPPSWRDLPMSLPMRT